MESNGWMNAFVVVWILGAPLVVGVIELFSTPKPDERPSRRPDVPPAPGDDRGLADPAPPTPYGRSPVFGLPTERL